jgi:ABC-type glutathione transport system ATPase component
MRSLPSSQVVAVRSRLDRVLGRRDELRARLARSQAEVARLEAEEEVADLASGVIRTLIDNEVSASVKAVEELLTEGLQVVFDDQDLSVRADVDVQRGKVSVDFVTVQKHPNGTVTEGLSRESNGGAVTTVQSILLRIIVAKRRGLRSVIFMDETLPAFDSKYVVNMAAFVKTLCERLGVDILLVCHHQPAMEEAADTAYRIHVNKADGAATFRRVRGSDGRVAPRS